MLLNDQSYMLKFVNGFFYYKFVLISYVIYM
jgi:hypothetical protein